MLLTISNASTRTEVVMPEVTQPTTDTASSPVPPLPAGLAGRPPLPEVPGFRHRWVDVRGASVHVAEAGTDDAPPVLLLHGFPQHWYAWRGVAGDLARDRHVVVPDLPGFGWSEPASHGWSTAQRAADTLALLDALGLHGPVDVAGHDWGAWLAFRVALDAPGRVRRLVAVSELHPWPLQRRLVPRLWRMWVTALFEVPGLGSAVQRRRGAVRWFLSRDARDGAVWTDDLVDAYAAVTARPDVAHAGRRLHSAFVLHDIARMILRRDGRRAYDVPTQMVAGDHDAYIPPALVAPPRSRADVVQVWTVPGGHFVLDENPRAVADAVRGHLDAPDEAFPRVR
ncbi:alpha/beta fold hydrolase [Luteimicrobium sp. NPDC057192]|uniref:alpha/beta fold hydrolase n=1 Tax=Luteimicrobium sp. NPDC057192 TaxID=3346042 RepID=UPI00362CB798